MTENNEVTDTLGDVTVLYEDNHLLVVNKPAGLLSQSAAKGDDNLVARGKAYLKVRYAKPGNVFLGCVHRLDRNVSGVVVLARTSKAASRLSKAFASRRVDKSYVACVDGDVPEAGKLEHRIAPHPTGRGVVESNGGKQARLSFECRARSRGRSLIEIQLETGRKHQIRAQLAWSGFPVTGDPLYGTALPSRLGRPALHAVRLSFDHPVGGAPMVFRAPFPSRLLRFLHDEKFDRLAISAFA